jgi:hypothetical protein
LLYQLEHPGYDNGDIVGVWQDPHPATKWAVDTQILVRDRDSDQWVRRYFAEFKDGVVRAFNYGSTSWSQDVMNGTTRWQQAKLADE